LERRAVTRRAIPKRCKKWTLIGFPAALAALAGYAARRCGEIHLAAGLAGR